MQLHRLLCSLLLSALAVGCAGTSRPRAVRAEPKRDAESRQPAMFFPHPLTDDWSQWIVGEWEGAGESDTGKGNGKVRIELGLTGQFLICRGEAEITELNPEYLKKHLRASDEEIERFKRSGYQSLEIYTTDPKTGEVIGFLFDNLRCLATGKGRREGPKEIIEWEWRTGHKSTRITERVSADRMRIIERTANPDGSVMEDKGELVRSRKQPHPKPDGE